MMALEYEYNNFTFYFVFYQWSLMGLWSIHQGLEALAHVAFCPLLPPHLSRSGSWPPVPCPLGPVQPASFCQILRQWPGHVGVPPLPSVFHHCPLLLVEQRLSEHLWWYLRVGHGSTISPPGWQYHSAFVGYLSGLSVVSACNFMLPQHPLLNTSLTFSFQK